MLRHRQIASNIEVEIVRNDIPLNLFDTQSEGTQMSMITPRIYMVDRNDVSASDLARITGGVAPHLAEGTGPSESMPNEVYRAPALRDPFAPPSIVDSPRPSTFEVTNEHATEQPSSNEDNNPWVGLRISWNRRSSLSINGHDLSFVRLFVGSYNGIRETYQKTT